MFATSIYVKQIPRMTPVSKYSETPQQQAHLQRSDLYNEELTTSQQDIVYMYDERKCCAITGVIASAGRSSLVYVEDVSGIATWRLF